MRVTLGLEDAIAFGPYPPPPLRPRFASLALGRLPSGTGMGWRLGSEHTVDRLAFGDTTLYA